MSQQNLIDAIYTTLSGDNGVGGVYTLTSGRIYNEEGPVNAALPMVVFDVTEEPPTRYFGGGTDIDATVEVDVYGLKRLGEAATRTIAEAVYAKLGDQTISVTGHANASMHCLDRGQVEDLDGAWHIQQRYKLLASVS